MVKAVTGWKFMGILMAVDGKSGTLPTYFEPIGISASCEGKPNNRFSESGWEEGR
jgi:hypothetical protein